MYFFNIVSIGVASCIFDFAVFIGIIIGWSKDLAEYDDDDDDKVEESLKKKLILVLILTFLLSSFLG